MDNKTEQELPPYKVRVDHPSGIHSFYEFDGNDYFDAEDKARRQFMIDFGFTVRSELSCFTYNKCRTFDEIPWAEELREGLKNA